MRIMNLRLDCTFPLIKMPKHSFSKTKRKENVVFFKPNPKKLCCSFHPNDKNDIVDFYDQQFFMANNN